MFATVVSLSALLYVPNAPNFRLAVQRQPSRRYDAVMADDNKKTVSVADLGLTIDDLQKPLPTEMAEGLQTSGVESVSRINEDSGCQWTETSGTIEATLTIPGLRGQPAGCLAVEVTETTATVTAFGQTTWSCILRGLVDPGSARARIDADGMQPVVRLALDKVESLRWGGLIKQLGEDSILR